MEIKVDLSDEYHVQFYENDDGNIVISGSVNCDCYDEEVLEVILKPGHVLKLLEEDWFIKIIENEINKELAKRTRQTKEPIDLLFDDIAKALNRSKFLITSGGRKVKLLLN